MSELEKTLLEIQELSRKGISIEDNARLQLDLLHGFVKKLNTPTTNE